MASIGGTVSGSYADTTILLVNNGTDIIRVNGDGNFTFDKKIQAGAAYNVTLFNNASPTGLGCTVMNGTGKVNPDADKVSNIAVSCHVEAAGFLYYNVGVTVSGLAPGGVLTLQNNGTDTLTANANGLFIFSQRYAIELAPAGGQYSVTLSANPTGQTCTLTDASGDVSQPPYLNFANVNVNCR
ncbi:MAG: hypothetical protein V4724_16480 [Pseudomonadota bacterium]